MKRCLKLVIVLLGPGLYFQLYGLRAQESHLLSQKAADIEATDPAQIPGQGSEDIYSRQNLCQIGEKIAKPTKSKKGIRSISSRIDFESSNDRKINPGIPLNTVLDSLAQEEDDQPSDAIEPQPTPRDCE